MTLKPGVRLGPYEIPSPLSVVSLGEFYRGRDHEEGRDVAIRVLRTTTDADPTFVPRLAAGLIDAREAFRDGGTVTALATVHGAIASLGGDLWLQVNRYEDARQAYADAADRLGPSLWNMVGSGRASSRLKDVLAACTSYGAFLETWGKRPGLPSEIAEARTYVENVCASADAPG